MAGAVVGIDVGGTFTDLFALSPSGLITAKVPSTRKDPSHGIRAAIASAYPDAEQVSTIVHGTTVATNALLERSGARTGVITTRGFKDVLEMRRRDRPRTWGLRGRFEPLIPRDLRLEVDERVLADGTVLTRVDGQAIEAACRELLGRGAQSLCIFFINAYANPINETQALAAARKVWPNQHITVASDMLPEIREFERASTASLNAYLQPLIGDYLERLDNGLARAGFGGSLLVVQSNGGIMSAKTARALPVRTALSGPAAGVIAAAKIAQAAGQPNIVTCDMGGTSFDVALVVDGKTALTAQTAVAFGMVIRSPMVEVTTIGAGGGSIAAIDRSGLLQVGPQSAGSEPGPACYGAGNTRPTVTDANLVLGRINAARPMGGKMRALDSEAATAAIDTHIGQPLGLNTVAAAEAIVRVANARMAGAIRLVSIERGHDPARFAAMLFGGAGALHVGALIKEVGLAKALVPRFPGVNSALGCVLADMRHDRVHTLNAPLDSLCLDLLRRRMEYLAEEGRQLVLAAGTPFERLDVEYELDMLYTGQTHTIAVPLALTAAALPTLDAAFIERAFEKAYLNAYGRLLEGLPLRVINLRVAVIGRRPQLDLSVLAPPPGATVAAAERGVRQVWDAGRWREARVYDRLALPAGAGIQGPALFEQDDATVFLEHDLSAMVDAMGNLIIQHHTQAH
ncbi:MAG: hydantoinase/oxoprolinase family protein [Gammaproteobacteria bacterium]|nr:hydantoinase/oxoprolinase family protein [Gammaproteobacteria bacterium]